MNRGFDIDDNGYFNFYNRVKQLRIDAELSQADLSKLSGVSPACISLIEKGKREPSLKTAIALSKALNISLDVFAGIKEYPVNEYIARIETTKLYQKISQAKAILESASIIDNSEYRS